MSRWLRLRCQLDRALAAIVLVVTSPLIAVAMVLVRRHDRGPALIAVPRVGRDGREFRMWKLRSMRVETPGGMAAGVALTSEGDPRVTPIGAKLRAVHLDELPQLYNVVRGEMSLLGPRPEAPAFVDVGDPRWRHVLTVPPGIAGPTQLLVGEWERVRITADPSGDAYRTEVVPVKLAVDAWYLAAASPVVDALVAAALIGRALGLGGGAGLERRVRREVPEARHLPLKG